jgi:hypothetical protein
VMSETETAMLLQAKDYWQSPKVGRGKDRFLHSCETAMHFCGFSTMVCDVLCVPQVEETEAVMASCSLLRAPSKVQFSVNSGDAQHNHPTTKVLWQGCGQLGHIALPLFLPVWMPF